MKVEKYFIHPRYKKSNLNFDFAIVKLPNNLKLPGFVNFIKLPEKNDKLVAEDVITAYGYGDTKNFTTDDYKLRKAEVPIFPFEQCRVNYANIKLIVTENMFCAGYPEGGKGSCHGDSGGPLIRKNDKVTIGVVSWGKKCALPNLPGVNAKVSIARTWIKKITNI